MLLLCLNQIDCELNIRLDGGSKKYMENVDEETSQISAIFLEY
jgi:hypothetical protein